MGCAGVVLGCRLSASGSRISVLGWGDTREGVVGFLFEDLDVYKLALDLAEKVRGATKSFPRGEWQLVDQFRRAAMSVPLNIAEGAGRYHPREKKQFYWIARGSCFECVPIVTGQSKAAR